MLTHINVSDCKNSPFSDDRLFYTGPAQMYWRLVVMSEEEKEAALKECHNTQGTGNHSGARGTRNRVIARYFWPTINKDVTDWVRYGYQVYFLYAEHVHAKQCLVLLHHFSVFRSNVVIRAK